MASAPSRPHRHRHPLTRLIDRRRRVLAALLAAVALLTATLLVRPPPVTTAAVLVAARDLDPARALAERDLVRRDLPGHAVPSGALAPETDWDGALINAPVRRGEVITDARLADPPARAYGPGLVAAPVRVADPGAVDLLSPGSRVDVLAATGPGDPHRPRARPAQEVATDRPVLAVPDEDARSGEGGALLLIAATPDEARVLAGHAAASRLSITIRG
ncbi:Flp pilus assembly protein CpaB [Nocardiopsis sp. CNR-923]|uniref:Flp pilus assembly protein CpaB n=1 Tax=Nocardiopsis sp. CNR-923 TaxID=1904965 RepID=UPI00095E3C67|nr:Flp pilus assembly protein CpaB [Nocardiopsis sp. CNR-923]OLT27227.1 Flp pilus assembly protein CpaB [Nocardiopsis sp. CNR-923]